MQNNVFRHDRKTTTMKFQQYDFLNENYIMRTAIYMPLWTGQFYKVLHPAIDLKWVNGCGAGESALSREELPRLSKLM